MERLAAALADRYRFGFLAHGGGSTSRWGPAERHLGGGGGGGEAPLSELVRAPAAIQRQMAASAFHATAA